MFEVHILPRTTEMDAMEEQLQYSLVAFVGGSRPVASPEQVASHLLCHFDVGAEEVRVHRYRVSSFLLCFHNSAKVDWVLHVPRPSAANLTLIFSHYTRQVGDLFSPLRFKVLISIENLAAHTCSISTTQEVLGSSVLIFDVLSASSSGSGMSQFLVAAWARHPDLISNEVGGIVP
jgi:hypothetical protein